MVKSTYKKQGKGVVRDMKIAFVCNGSSARAQLAAAIGREFFKEADITAVGSIEGEAMDPMVKKVLAEDDIPVEGMVLKTLFDMDFDSDYAIVVGCDEGGCPLVFAEKVLEWDFITNLKNAEEEAYVEAKNQLKEEIKKFYMETFQS